MPSLFKTMFLLDRFGSNISFQIDGSQTYKHCLGSLITIIILIASLALSGEIVTHFLNYTNPTISAYTEYDLKSIEFNYTDFFFGVTFYDPIKDYSKSIGIKDNNYTTIKYINQLNLTCETCDEIYKSTRMSLCAEEQYLGKKIKSMSEAKSNSLIGFFKSYSFCFPEGINGTIQDINITETNSTQDTSLSIFIPISSVSIEKLDIPRNSQGVPDASSPTDIVKVANVVAPASAVIKPPAPIVQLTQQSIQSQIQPMQSGAQPTKSGNQSTQSQTTHSGDQQTQSSFQPIQSGAQLTPSSVQPTQSGIQQMQSSFQPMQSGTQPKQSGANPTQSGALFTSPTTTTPTQSTPPPARLLQQSTSSSLQDTTVNTQMQNILDMFKFPKMLVLNRSFELNPGASKPEDLLKYIYNLELLDYRDPLSGNPIVYDIYVQKKKIIVIRPENFSTKTEITNVLSIQRIEKNEFDSLQNNGAYFSFKLYSDVEVIKITYVNLTDVLSVFGSFFTTLTLVGAVAASVYQDVFLHSGMIDSVFKFVDNDPKEFKKVEFNLVKQIRENKLKTDIENEMKKINENKEKYKNYRIEVPKYDNDDEDKNELGLYNNCEENISVNNCQNFYEIYKENDLYSIKNGVKKISNGENNISKFQEDFSNINLIPIDKKEKISLFNKVKEIENIEANQYWANKLSLSEIYEINKIKKKKRNLIKLSPCNMLLIKIGFRKCFNNDKVTIWQKALEIIKDNIQIVTLIRRNMEVEEMKKTIFSPKELILFKYYMKNINYQNPKESIEFLDKFLENKSVDKIKILKDDNDKLRGNMSKTLYNNFKNKFNY